MNREIKFEYVWKCSECGHSYTKIYSLDELEGEYGDEFSKSIVCEHADGTDGTIKLLCRRLFTRLHDKNGKEIYEGEITPHSDTKHNGGTITTHYGVVEWDSSIASFVLRIHEDGSQEDLYESCKWFESVGNIYENPELLEESK